MLLKWEVMIYAVPPVHSAWIYTFILQPHLEGVERLNRVWSGMDFDSFQPRRLSLKERAIYLISALPLITPLIATIVWFFMITFGHSDQLSDPYYVVQADRFRGQNGIT